MPLRPEDLLSKRTMPAPAPTTTGAPRPPTGTAGAGMPTPEAPGGQPGFATPQDITQAATAGLPSPVASGIRAFQHEIGEPIQRNVPGMVNRAIGMIPGMADAGARETGLPQPLSLGQSATDFAQVMFDITPSGRMVAVGGMALEAGLDFLTQSPNISRTVATMAQGAKGAYDVVRAVRAAGGPVKIATGLMKEGAELLKPQNVSKIGKAARTKIEQLGFWLRSNASAELNKRRTDGVRLINERVNAIVTAAPSINPNDPAYAVVRNVMQSATQDVRLTGEAGDLFNRIDQQLQAGLPVSTADVAALRTATQDATRFRAAARINGPVSIDPVGELRTGLNSTLETHAPGQLGTDFRNARSAFVHNYINPAKALDDLVDEKVTAAQAFNSVFNLKDQQLFRATMDTINNTPGLRGRMRAGFIESLVNADGKLVDAEKATAAFRDLSPQLIATGLFNKDEITALSQMTRAENIPRLMDAFSVLAPAGAKRSAVLPSVLSFGGISLFGPIKMLSLIAGSGAIMEFRRLAIMGPEVTPATKRLAATITGRVDDYAKAVGDVMANISNGPDHTD